MPWQCFMLTPTDEGVHMLRRISTDPPQRCPRDPLGMHVQTHIIGMITISDPEPFITSVDYTVPKVPMTCDCGYVFTDQDQMQDRIDRLFVDPNGKQYTINRGQPNSPPPGAMWDLSLPWDDDRILTADGRRLEVMLPTGKTWIIDADHEPGRLTWQRTGVPPNLTVTPSILTKHYHGWLTKGILSDDLGGRTYD